MKQRYDSYKSSGIDWIGDIPSHWNIAPIKQICRSERYAVKTGPFGSQLKGEDLREKGDIRVYNQRNVIDDDFSDVANFVTSEKAKELDSFYTKPNDLLITSRGTIGKSAILPSSVEMGILHPCLIALRIDFSEANLKWVQRWINDSEAFRIEIVSKSNATTIDVIYTETIKNIRLALPPLAEQEAIAAWLDEKCQEIDAAIAKIDREIELIDELKQSEISRVVTRGLNPDVSLRPSGIDWIGDIPGHWTIAPFKRSLRINNGCDYKHIVTDDGYPVIGSGGQFAYASDYLYDGEVLLLGRKGTIDRPMHFVGKFWTVDTMFYAIPNDNVCCKYMYYQALGFPYDYYSTATALPSMAASDLANNPIIVPPLREQQEIADYLDKKCAEIDGLKAKLTKKRETLTELRQSIISEVVTGKQKVI